MTSARPLPGTAQYVVANAAMRRVAGLGPILPYLTHTDPVEALKAAQAVVACQTAEGLKQTVGAIITQGKKFREMTDDELRTAAQAILRTSNSVDEARRRIREELDYPYHISLHADMPSDKLGYEARDLVRALGGSVMANGAMVSGMMHGRDGLSIVML
jgi:hypothetical protein